MVTQHVSAVRLVVLILPDLLYPAVSELAPAVCTVIEEQELWLVGEELSADAEVAVMALPLSQSRTFRSLMSHLTTAKASSTDPFAHSQMSALTYLADRMNV